MSQIINMPKLGFDMAEGTLVRWVKMEGDEVNKGDVLAEIETDKATVEVESIYEGVVNRHLVEEGSLVPVGDPIAIIAAHGEEIDPKIVAEMVKPASRKIEDKTTNGVGAPPETPAQVDLPGKDLDIKASPLAKRLASDLGLDLENIRGSGPGGRIVKRDIKAAEASLKRDMPETEGVMREKVTPVINDKTLPPIIGMQDIPEDERVPVSKLRGIIGRRMVEAKQQAPHFYITHVYDVENLLNARKKLNDILPEENAISINDLIVKATAMALRLYPNLNTSIDKDKIIRHGHINIGIAVALEDGLLTVVCRDADIKPLRIISHEIREMVQRSRQGKMRPEDIEGSTFSISNLGMYDVEHFIAIINPPEAAVLAVGSARRVPAIVNGEVSVSTQIKATLSADHRITDGAEAARFLKDLALFIEEPSRLLL